MGQQRGQSAPGDDLHRPAGARKWHALAHRGPPSLLGRRRFSLESSTPLLLGPSGVENKDAVVFTLADGRVALIHRIHPNIQLAVFDDLDHLWHAPGSYWSAHLRDLHRHTLLRPASGALGVGAGAPPVLTEAGPALLHERRADGLHHDLALLDQTTGRARSRLPEPLLEPELSWERHGDVNEVVFVQGAHLDGDEVYLTYGAADRCVGAAVASVSHLLDALTTARPRRTPPDRPRWARARVCASVSSLPRTPGSTPPPGCRSRRPA